MQKFSFKRFTAWMLTLVMLIGVMPVGALAGSITSWKDFIQSAIGKSTYQQTDAEDSESADYDIAVAAEETEEENIDPQSSDSSEQPIAVVVAASDFQQNDGHSVSDSVMENIITAMTGAGYTKVDGAIFCGDYSNSESKTESDTGLSYVYGNYNGTWDLDYDDIVFVQGNHDPADTSYLDPTGANDPESGKYGVYVLNEDAYPRYGGDEQNIMNLAAQLKSYLDAKIEAKFDAPIFIASHLPLHYSMRTYREGDCRYAQYIFNVLNEASEAGLNIIYLYGHNHSQSFENYHGGGAVFYSAGDEILIGDTTDNKTHHTETIQFTYLNAGYTGRFDSEDTADPTNTGTVYEIYDDKVVITRFDASGTHNLKSAGVQSAKYYSDEFKLYNPNTRTETSPQTIELNRFEPDLTVEDEPTGISVTAPGITGVSVMVKNPDYDTERYTAYASYDIELTGYTQGNTATVTIPAPDDFDTSKSAVVLYEDAVIATDTNISDGITFTTNHFSTYDVAQVDESYGATASGYLAADATVDISSSAPQAGNYYLIRPVRDGNGTLTNVSTKVNNSTGLDVVDKGLNAQDNNVWYYDGTHIIHRRTGQYLSVGPGQDAAALTDDANATNLVNSVYENTNYRGTYTLAATQNTTNYKYLNRTGSGSFAGAWSSDGNGDEGSRWYFYKVTFSNTDPVTLTVTPASKTIVTGTTANLTASVLVNNAAATSSTITWTSSNTDAATVDANGVVTGVKDGNATITATLTRANDQNVNGTVAVEIPVTVATKEIKSIAVAPMEGSVERGSKASTQTGSTITVTYEDGTSENIPVTVGMLTGTYILNQNGTYTGLSITYAGQTVSNYTLKVVNVSGNDFPSYPEGGSVKVTKSATGQDFQNTGVARVELSTSGLPSKKGVDVIVMLDTSSSMTSNNVDDDSQTRAAALRESLATLVSQLQADGPDGEPMDIKIAIADFNGYYVSNTNTTRPYNLETTDHLKGTTVKSTTDNFGAEIYTGTGNLTAGAFVDVHDINGQTVANALNFQSGTNYDYAFDAVYQLGTAIKAANEEERDLYVVFMSDGGPFQYNYFSTQSEANNGGDLWNHWLTGKVVDSDWDDTPHSYFYNSEGKHWMAEAIKGDPSQNYTIIRKNATEFIDVTGDGVADQYMTQVPGLGATMYSIGFCAEKDDNAITAASIQYVLKNIASNEELYHTANDGDDLNGVFRKIASDIRYAAQNAYFEDQMGTAFALQMNPNIVDSSDNTRIDISTDITVTEYPIYTKAQIDTTVNGHRVTAEDVGKTYSDGTVLETVKFTSDTAATSSELTDANIIKDGVICAKNFFYNTTSTTKTITLTNGSTYQLPGETFYWNIGTINEKQFTLSYAVYLTGSMEGECPGGSYDTNNYATLDYTNWLGNNVEQKVDSPTMAWDSANVSYAFYLVNSEGKPVDANGIEVPNIVTAYKDFFKPQLYKTINLNSGETVLSTVADDVLPDGYTLYDETAVYTVTVNSGTGGGGWTIAGTFPASTYVTGHAGQNEYSNETPVDESTYDYTHTTVYFAVVWTIGTVPDSVVIDYGLPVDINVLDNDMFGGNGALVGVGETAGTLTDKTGFGNSYTGHYGTATLNGNKVRYTPADMNMKSYDQFAYAVKYTGTTNSGYYYGTVTVIPATTIYYEEKFITFYDTGNEESSFTEDKIGYWWKEGSYTESPQSEDRPGSFSFADANNLYGYDGINSNSTTYSLGSAVKVTVDATLNSQELAPSAVFTFTGTGFDVISLTNSDCGVVFFSVKKIKDENGAALDEPDLVKSKFVDNYYGYSYADGVWTPNLSADGSVYQVPVMKIAGLDYATYQVEIFTFFNRLFEHDTDSNYSFWLDSIRIYDPAGDGIIEGEGEAEDDTTIRDAYIADDEYDPHYYTIRDLLVEPENIEDITVSDTGITDPDVDDPAVIGIVFIDGSDNNGIADIELYANPGPNNETYLANGQGISFKLSSAEKPASTQIGAKLAFGTSASVKVGETSSINNGKPITTMTDMYYTLPVTWTDNDEDGIYETEPIIISNASDEDTVVSLTNLKLTFEKSEETSGTDNDTTVQDRSVEVYVDEDTVSTAKFTMRKLYSAAPVFEPEVFEYSISSGWLTNTMTVITSKDVESLTINGEAMTNLSTSASIKSILSLMSGFANTLGIDLMSDDYYVWSKTVRSADEYVLVAADADGNEADPVTVASDGSTITVEDFRDTIRDTISNFDIREIMENLAERVFNPDRMEAMISRRPDGRVEAVVTTSEDVDYIMVDGEIVDHYITETVIDLGTDETSVSRVFVTEVEDGAAEVTAYNEEGVASSSENAGE